MRSATSSPSSTGSALHGAHIHSATAAARPTIGAIHQARRPDARSSFSSPTSPRADAKVLLVSRTTGADSSMSPQPKSSGASPARVGPSSPGRSGGKARAGREGSRLGSAARSASMSTCGVSRVGPPSPRSSSVSSSASSGSARGSVALDASFGSGSVDAGSPPRRPSSGVSSSAWRPMPPGMRGSEGSVGRGPSGSPGNSSTARDGSSAASSGVISAPRSRSGSSGGSSAAMAASIASPSPNGAAWAGGWAVGSRSEPASACGGPVVGS